MELSKRSLVIFGFGWLTSLVLIGSIAGYYYLEYQNLLKTLKGCVMHIDICINYTEWNGTIAWYNDTIVPLGCNLLSATEKIAIVNYTYWASYQASFVDAINGVWNNNPYYWMWYRWNGVDWEYGLVGADRYILSPNEIVRWRYEKPNYP